MKTIISIFCVLVLTSTADACHRCRCYTRCTYTPVITNKVDVQFNHLRLVNQEPAPKDKTVELALQRQWELLTSAIPIAQPINQNELFKPFKFKNNLPPYRAPQQVQDAGYQEVKYVQKTKIYHGLVNFNIRIEPDGNVNLVQPQ